MDARMKYFLVIPFLLFSHIVLAQEQVKEVDKVMNKDTLTDGATFKSKTSVNRKVDTLSIRNYKIISQQRDTTFLDTTLTIYKEYKYNYLRRDEFELMPFGNIAQAYNKLGVDLERQELYPRIGARAKHHVYKEVREMEY